MVRSLQANDEGRKLEELQVMVRYRFYNSDKCIMFLTHKPAQKREKCCVVL